MSLKPDIQYLRVRHLGVKEISLYLSDLDTEQNKKQHYKIPVYVQEGASVDLPLNDQVLLSYAQGSIRSFIDQGFLSGHVVSDDGEAEVFVSPEGDDNNPGTRTAPFLTIQAAHDSFIDRGMTGRYPAKVIKLLQGTHLAAAHINLQSVSIRADQESPFSGVYRDFMTHIRPGKSDRPAITVSPMSHYGFEQYLLDGGATTDGSVDQNYTGADLMNREIAPWLVDQLASSRSIELYFSLHDIGHVNFGDYAKDMENPLLLFLGVPFEGQDRINLQGLTLSRGVLWGALESFILFKNCRWIKMEPHYNHQVSTVFDNSGGLSLKGHPGRLGNIIFKQHNNETAEWGDPRPLFSAASSNGNPIMVSSLDIADSTSVGLINDFHATTFDLWTYDGDINLAGAANHSTRANNMNIHTSGLTLAGSGDLWAESVTATTITHSGTGNMSVVRDIIVSGTVTVDDGSFTVSGGGTIEGDLIVNTPATADLTNVTVKGNISGTGTVTQNGGGYLGTNTASTYTHNAIKTV